MADDATGALEVGGKLAAGGVLTSVTTRRGLEDTAEALVVDLETRHLEAGEAARRVGALAAAARAGSVSHLYKKTDSTLRGNIPAEFQALIGAFPGRPLVYVPAYPRMKRTVVRGELFVDGKPLAETATAEDRLNPSREGNIPALLKAGCSAPVSLAGDAAALRGLLGSSAPGSIIVCDGAGEDDLRETGRAIHASGRPCIVAGTGGFVGEWAAGLPLRRGYDPPQVSAGRCLVVSGSLHPASRAQVRRAESAGIPTCYFGRQPDRAMIQALAGHAWAVFATPGGHAAGVAGRMAALVRAALAACGADCLVIFGGDTALAILKALGIMTVRSAGELLPGVPVSLAAYEGRPLALATKAGGFGAEDTLLQIKERLENRA